MTGACLLSLWLLLAIPGNSYTETCNNPLGFENGIIKDSQFMASTAYNNDLSLYGPQRARLYLSSWPQGYRGNINAISNSWLLVNFDRNVVITGIATQGYGENGTEEWVEEFMLFYSTDDSEVEESFTTSQGSDMWTFKGNSDDDTIHRQNVLRPRISSRVRLLPLRWHNNVGLRMELYGCELDGKYYREIPAEYTFVMLFLDYHVDAWLMFKDTLFQNEHRNSSETAARVLIDSAIKLIREGLEREYVYGYLGVQFIDLSPQISSSGFTALAIRIRVLCLPDTSELMIRQLTRLSSNEDSIFESGLLLLRLARTDGCNSPSVSISPSTRGSPKVLSVLRQSYPAFHANIDFNCTTENKLLFFWQIAEVDQSSGFMTPIMYIGKPNSPTLKLSPKDYPPRSTLYIRCIALLQGTIGSFSLDYKYVTFIEADLVAKIVGTSFVIQGQNNMTLDSTSSYVTISSELSKNVFLELYWYCRKFTPWKRIRKGNVITCSGNGTAISSSGTLMLDANKLAIGEYTFELIANAYGVRSSAVQGVKVYGFTELSIECQSNCAKKINPQQQQILEALCSKPVCKYITSYIWSIRYLNEETLGYKDVFFLNSSHYQKGKKLKLNNLQKLIETSGKKDKPYHVDVNTFMTNSLQLSSSADFILNSVPSASLSGKSGCFVKPLEGIAMHTNFHLSCEHWKDEDRPLSFKYQYLSDFGLIIIQSGYSANAITQVLPGNVTFDYLVNLEFIIVDSFGATAEVILPITVSPPTRSEADTVLTSIDGTLENLVSMGDPNKAAEMSLFSLSLMKIYDTPKTEERKVKNIILQQLRKVNVTSLPQVTKYAILSAEATDQEEELSDHSQTAAIDLITAAANAIESLARNGTAGVDMGVVSMVASRLTHGVNNVLSSSDPSEDVRKSAVDKAKKESLGSLEIAKIIGRALAGVNEIGSGPVTIRSDTLSIKVTRDKPSSFDGIWQKEEKSMVLLPPSDDLFPNKSTIPAFLDIQIIKFASNPFYWHKTAEPVNSEVVDISVFGPHGIIKVSNLTRLANIIIPIKNPEERQVRKPSELWPPFVKPTFNVSSMQNVSFHRIYLTSSYTIATVRIIPEMGKTLQVLVKSGSRPTNDEYDMKTSVPDLTTCLNNEFSSWKDPSNCSINPFDIQITSLVTGATGVHYIGIRYIPKEHDGNQNVSRDILSVKRRSVGPKDIPCGSNSGRQRRAACVRVKDPPTTPPPPMKILRPEYDVTTDVTYSISVDKSACLFWREDRREWSSDGCKVGSLSNETHVHCLCNHLTMFGGDFFVAPNPIDFDRVFLELARLEETGNYVVIATVCTIWTLYVLGLIIARKVDQKDRRKVFANVHLADDIQEGFVYQISVQTGMWRGYGTTANIGLTIFGEEGKTGEIPLTDPELQKVFFARGSINNFTLVVPDDLGELTKIKIQHDNSGKSPAWFFHQVMIVDVQTAKSYYFLANRWLAVEKDDGKIDIEIPKAKKKDLAGFRNLFYSRTARSLGDGHLWLSVFTRPPHNPFTRCQRLGCCLSILFATMVTNAMFYQFGAEPKDSFKIGPLKMSWTQIKIGIQSSVIAIPVNIIFVAIFRNIKQTTPQRDTKNAGRKKEKTPGCLPHFFVYFGWSLCILTALSASVFTVFYSLMWGADVSNNWLTSIMVSFFQDVIITQPIKVVAIASLLSLILKKPPAQDKVLGASLSKTKDRDGSIVPPAGHELERQRIYRNNVIAMFRTVVEIVFFIIFLILTVVVCYGNRTSSRYQMTKSIRKVFSNFDKVASKEMFWEWTHTKLVPALFKVDWYNGRPFEYAEGFISSREAFIVGMPRLRQIRIKPDPLCPVEVKQPVLAHMFQRCLPLYRHEKEDITKWNMPGWKPVRNFTKSMSVLKLQDICPKPWRYQSSSELQSLSFEGKSVNYDGGGFVADLGYNIQQASEILNNLKRYNWIDDRTTAVFVEFTVFEPTTSLFSAVKYVIERFRNGGYHTRETVKTLVLYSSSDSKFQSFYQVCQLMLMLMIVFSLFVEFGKIYREGRNYPKQFWNWMELVQIFSTVAAIVMFFFKEKYTSEFVKRVRKNPYETSSTDYIVLWSDLEIYLLSLVIFVVTVKFLRLIRFNHSICQMTGTITRSAKGIASFFTVFVACLLAFTQLGFLAFGSRATAYSSFFESLRSCLTMVLGGNMHFFELQEINRILGPAFAFVYIMSMTMILLNMFLAILNDSYEETREENGEKFSDADMAEFMIEYFRSRVGYLRKEGENALKMFKGHLIIKFRPKKDEVLSVEMEYTNSETDLSKETDIDNAVDVISKIRMASLDSIPDLFSDEEVNHDLEDLKSSVSDLRRSIVMLASVEETKTYQPSRKWDSPPIEGEPTRARSIFDRPPPLAAGSLVDRPPYVPYSAAYVSPYTPRRLFDSPSRLFESRDTPYLSLSTGDETSPSETLDGYASNNRTLPERLRLLDAVSSTTDGDSTSAGEISPETVV